MISFANAMLQHKKLDEEFRQIISLSASPVSLNKSLKLEREGWQENTKLEGLSPEITDDSELDKAAMPRERRPTMAVMTSQQVYEGAIPVFGIVKAHK